MKKYLPYVLPAFLVILGAFLGLHDRPVSASSIEGLPGMPSITRTLSEADLLSTSTAPFTIIPAPGAGRVIFPFAIRWRVHGGTLPYYDISDCAGTCLWWGDNTNPFWIISSGTAGFSSNSESPIFQILGFASPLTPFPDAAYFTAGLGADPSQNNLGGRGINGTDPASYANKPIVVEGYGSEPSNLNRGPVLTTAPNNPGMMYQVNDQVQQVQAGGPPPDCIATVTSVNGMGGVTGLANTVPGTFCEGGTGIPMVNVGNLQSATVTGGAGGGGYTNGDMGDVLCGQGGTYTVTGSLAGVVTAVSVTGGMGYNTQAGCMTQPETGGGDGTLQLDIVVSNAGSGLTTNTTVQHGDGSLTVTIWYTIAPL